MREFSDIHKSRMGKALGVARRAASRGEVPIGAALFHGDRLLFSSGNCMETRHDPTAHAEMLVLRKLSRFGGIDHADLCLYITLEPCPMCAGAIILSHIGTVVWGAADPRFGAAGSAFRVLCQGMPPPQPLLISGVREEECGQLLIDFFAQLRK